MEITRRTFEIVNDANRCNVVIPRIDEHFRETFIIFRAGFSRFIVYIERGLLRHVSPPSLPPCLSSREPTHFTVSDLRLATRGITERGNYRGSDYLASRREIIACDVYGAATYRAKIPLRGRSFLPNCSRYCAIFFFFLFAFSMTTAAEYHPNSRGTRRGKLLRESFNCFDSRMADSLNKFVIE